MGGEVDNATSNSDEIVPRPWSPSFDEQAVRKQLSSVDPEQSLLRAHLWAEHFLVELINGGLAKPSALKSDRLSFGLKVEFAVSLGVMPEGLAPSLMCLNGLRNKAVHRLDYQFSDADKKTLLDSMPAGVRGEILKETASDAVSLPPILRCIVFLLDSLLHFHQERRRIDGEKRRQFVQKHGKTVERAFFSAGEKPPSWIYSQ